MALTRAEITRRYEQRHPEKVLEWRKARQERERGKIKPWLSTEEKQMIEALHQQGLSFKEIAGKVSRTGATVARHLRTKFNIRARPVPIGEKHQAWKGGRSFHRGYWHVRINGALVPEHRLIMERKLGRSLLRTETVHHINGDRADNQPENLQLRQGRHGKGVAMVCLDCGSYNIGPSDLK